MADGSTDIPDEGTFRMDLAATLPTAPNGRTALSPDAQAKVDIQARISVIVPRSLSDEEALRLSFASALRNPECAVESLFGRRFRKEMGSQEIGDMGVTDSEYGALLAALPPNTPTAPFDSLEAIGGVQVEVTQSLSEACQTTMLSDSIRVAWRRSCVRTAAAYALRTEHAVPMLAAVLGETSRSDARRVDGLLADLQDDEEANDEYLQPTCDAIVALAAALAASP